MKMKSKHIYTQSIKRLFVCAAMSSIAASFAAGESTPKYTGTFSFEKKDSLVGSAQEEVGIASDKLADLTSADIKADESDPKKLLGGSVSSGSIDLGISVKSSEGDATAFKAAGVTLASEKDLSAYSNPEVVGVASGNFKGVFSAEAHGSAVAASVGDIVAGESETYTVNSEEKRKDIAKSAPGNIDLTLSAKGASATGLEAGTIEAGAVGIVSAAESSGGAAVAVKAGAIYADSVKIDAAAVSKAVYKLNEDKSQTLIPGGPAEGVVLKSGMFADNASISASATAAASAATGIRAGDLDADSLEIKASAQTSVAASEIDKDGAGDKYLGGDAVALEAQSISGESASITASASAEGNPAADAASARGVKAGSISVGREDSIAVRNLKDGALQQNITKPLSAHIDVSASAGSLGEKGEVKYAGNAVGIEVSGDVEFVNGISVDNTAEKDEKASSVAPLYMADLEKSAAGVEVNGSVSAKSYGGDATAIKAGKLRVGTDIFLTQYEYEPELDDDGEVVLDKNGNTVYKKDKDGAYVLKKDSEGAYVKDVSHSTVAGDFNVDVSAEAYGGDAFAILAESVEANVKGSVSAKSEGGDALAIVSQKTEKMTVYGSVSAVSVDGGRAVGIASGDGIVNLADKSRISAEKLASIKDKDGEITGYERSHGTAIEGGVGGLEVNVVSGNAFAAGDVVSQGAMTVGGGGHLVVEGGTLRADSVTVGENAGLSLAIDRTGRLGGVDSQRVDFDAISNAAAGDKNAVAAEKRAGIIAGSATALVNDKVELNGVGMGNSNAFFNYDKDGKPTDLKASDLVNVDGNMVNYDYVFKSTEEGVVTNITGVRINSLSYFQDRAADANSRNLGASLDAIETVEAAEDETAAQRDQRLAEIQRRRDFKAAMDGADMRPFMPVSQSYIAQMNSEMLSNMNNVQMFRLNAVADAKRASQAARAQGEGGAAKQAARAPARGYAAELQSVNMLGSQDGGANAGGYDFWSVGGVAAIERDFGDSFFGGLSLGGIYNKVDGNDGADATSTNFLLNLYGLYTAKSMPLDVFLNLGYSHGWNETSRQTPLGVAESDYDSNSFYSLGGVAWTFADLGVKGLSVKPMLAYSFAYSHTDSQDETGAGFHNASLSGDDFTNFKTLLGVEVKYDILSDLSAAVRAFWSHEFCDRSYDVGYRIAEGAPFMNEAVFCGEESGRDAAVLGLGLNYRFSERLSAFADYSATVRDGYSGHAFSLGAQFKF